ncbi:MAG TPA: type I phosphomannose isomerase catalytic subunit [Salinimicrobium sp.]|nr:type I phosphomannose isomerase catalytic subunit [Salinimicrobium sp.]
MLNYPIKFVPILHEKIWGGDKLVTVLNKDSKKENLGESWEISGVKDQISIVANGTHEGKNLQELLVEFKEELVGKINFDKYGENFPLLIKFIDANANLSVQLHPNDVLSRERHDSFGKTEMWFIMQADEDAEINVGFNKNIEKQEYLNALEHNNLTDLLQFKKVQKGDSFFINTGKVHAIGAGVLLAEIQQTSDITYRIYDWERTDANGKPRELHTDLALDAIDFELKNDFELPYDKIENTSSEIASCPYFTTNFLPVKGELVKNYAQLDSFVIYMCVDGRAVIRIGDFSEKIETGESILIPATAKEVLITSDTCELLEVYIK